MNDVRYRPHHLATSGGPIVPDIVLHVNDSIDLGQSRRQSTVHKWPGVMRDDRLDAFIDK
ncbi:MAG: hypothetical protein WB816_03695 [Methylocystis sp.]